MESVLYHPAVKRVRSALFDAGADIEIVALSDSARSAQEAADALGILVGQVASSIVFKFPNGSPLLVITSGRHRVDTLYDFYNILRRLRFLPNEVLLVIFYSSSGRIVNPSR